MAQQLALVQCSTARLQQQQEEALMQLTMQATLLPLLPT
jgi:hypothetical protein